VLEGDITACFDEISHTALLERVRRRIGDRRVLALVKAFLKAAILGEDGAIRDTVTGTPQGGILSPLLRNLALSVLDEHIVEHGQAGAPSWVRQQRRHQGLPNYRIVRYADDFVVLVAGTRQHAEALREQVAAVLAPLACGCRRRRPPSATSTRALSSSAGASSATSNAEVNADTSTPTRPARPLRPSRRRCGRSPDRPPTSR
jgi:hypothetical protein